MCATLGHPLTSPAPTDADLAEVVKKLKSGADKAAKASEAPAATPSSVAPEPAASEAPSDGEDALPALLSRLDHWLAKHRSRFHKGLLPGATPEQLDALKAQLPCPLPDELRAI